MRKLLFVPVFLLGALLFNAQNTNAQQIANYTPCDYQIDVFLATPGSCTSLGFFTFNLAGFQNIPNLGVTPTFDVLGYRGYDVTFGGSCGAFKVGKACFGMPTIYSFSCVCTGTAETDPMTGDMKIY